MTLFASTCNCLCLVIKGERSLQLNAWDIRLFTMLTLPDTQVNALPSVLLVSDHYRCKVLVNDLPFGEVLLILTIKNEKHNYLYFIY